MNKKNILLTIWLLLPITIVSLLMVWIFYSLDKDRLMADAVPIGAGAGDTGNANAIGEWLAGRNPDAVSDALKARREGRAIDPREWPGGVEIHVVGLLSEASVPPYFLTFRKSGKQSNYPAAQDGDTAVSRRVDFDSEDPVVEIYFTITPDGLRTQFDHADHILLPLVVKTKDGKILKPILFEPQIPDPNLQVSDPMVVEVEVELKSTYVESP